MTTQVLLLFGLIVILVMTQLVNPDSRTRMVFAAVGEMFAQPSRDTAKEIFRIISDGVRGLFPTRHQPDHVFLSELLQQKAATMTSNTSWRQPGYSALGLAGDAPATVPQGMGEIMRALTLIDTISGIADPFRIPIMWIRNPDGSLALLTATFRPDRPNSVRHIALPGQSGSGKDVEFTDIGLTLMQRATPDQVQLCPIDEKGLDYFAWADAPHVFATPESAGGLVNVLILLDKERETRKGRLQQAGVKNWDEYMALEGVTPMPLLLVYVSELPSLERYIKNLPVVKGQAPLTLWDWMDSHLTSGRAFGMYFIVGAPTYSNTPTLWRRQFQMFIAGQQISMDDDRPCTGFTTRQIKLKGAVPPSELPMQPGYFCVRFKRMVVNGLVSRPLPGEEQAILQAMRDRWNVEVADEQSVDELVHETPELQEQVSDALPEDTAAVADMAPEAAVDSELAYVPPPISFADRAQRPQMIMYAGAPERADPLQAERMRIAIALVRDDGYSPTDATERVWNVTRGGADRFKINKALLVAELARLGVSIRRGRRGEMAESDTADTPELVAQEA